MPTPAESSNGKEFSFTKDWLAERFPQHPFIYFGISGTALFYEAIKSTNRKTIVLPAYMCSNFSAAAIRCGAQVVHIDADPTTQLPHVGNLFHYLEEQVSSETILVIDHSFGYPFSALKDVRSRFASLLIVEDCARALGVHIDGCFPGRYSDWLLLSMYKTTPGSNHGGILLTRTPVPISTGRPLSTTIRERLSTVEPLRSAYHLLVRATRRVELPHDDLGSPEWIPRYGGPSSACAINFSAQLTAFDKDYGERLSTVEELTWKLSNIDRVEVLNPTYGATSACHYLSVRTPHRSVRNRIILALRKKGLFVMPTWHVIPAHYRALAGTFPFGSQVSEDLADRMLHIPVTRLGRTKCVRLAREMPQLFVRAQRIH